MRSTGRSHATLALGLASAVRIDRIERRVDRIRNVGLPVEYIVGAVVQERSAASSTVFGERADALSVHGPGVVFTALGTVDVRPRRTVHDPSEPGEVDRGERFGSRQVERRKRYPRELDAFRGQPGDPSSPE